MKFIITENITDKYPLLRLGVMVAKGIDNTGENQKIAGVLHDIQIKIRNNKPDIENNKTILKWRETYKSFGAKPKKHKSSVEALISRVLSGGEINHINNLVDIYNYISLKYVLPVGGDDIGKVDGNIILKFADGTEKASMLGTEGATNPKKGEVVYCDDKDILCRRWNWRESEKSQMDENTKNAVIVIESLLPNEKLKDALDELSEIVEKKLGAKTQKFILDKNFPSLDIETGMKLKETIKTKESEILVKEKNVIMEKKKKKPGFQPKNDIEKKIFSLLKEYVNEEDIILERPPEGNMGDYAFPCFILSKKMEKSPVEIAKELESRISVKGHIEKAEANGPYINFFCNWSEYYKKIHADIMKNPVSYGSGNESERILIEYSAPNTNKPLHLGHVRNNTIGMAVSNILEFAGFDIIRVNLANDRGIHICKSMLAYKLFGNGETPESSGKKGDHFVGDYYVMYAQKEKEDPGLEEQAREMLRKWERGDNETVELWKKMNKWAFDGFNETYKNYGCKFDKWFYESETYELGKKVVLDGLKKGLFKTTDDNAVFIDLSKYGLGKKILMRSDGTTVYMTQDIGTTKLKYEEFSPDRMIWVVASEQNYHFQVLFRILNLLGYKWADKCYHLSYGMVYLPEGKMKSREGNVIDADDMLEELTTDALNEIEKRSVIKNDEVKVRIAREIALGAIKFFMLKSNLAKDIYYNPADSLSFEGDTAPFIQYAHTRISGILRKADTDFDEFDASLLNSQEEYDLIRNIYMFPEIVRNAANDYNPGVIVAYLLNIAKNFNKFYEKHQVLKAKEEEKKARLALIRDVKTVIKNALNLLGIYAPEKM